MDWEIFRDQIWNFIGVIIACVTLLITVIIYYFQKHKKGLSYEILSKTSLLTSKEKLEGKIKILYNEQEVQNVKFLEIKILNTGNVGIPSSDYERPIRFIFDAEAKILTAEIVKSEPDSLTTTLNITQNEIVIQPILMNSKDYLVIKAIVSNSEDEELIVDGRIKDVKSIKKQGESNMPIIIAVIGIVLTIVGMIQLTTIAKTVKVETPWTIQKTISVSLIALGYILMLSFVLTRGRYKRLLLQIFKT